MKKPRPYQTDAHQSVLRQLDQYDSTVVVLPTGLGKTVLAAKLISQWERGNCLFLAHTKELIEQAADKLGAELGYRPGIEMNIHGVEIETLWQGGMTVVGSVQTMYGDKRLHKYSKHPFGLIVIDECHHSTAATYKKVVGYFQAINPHIKVVGITATPNRADGTALGLMFESVAYQMSINDAVTDGWLVPVTQEYVVVDEIDFDGIKTKKNEFGEADFAAGQLEEMLTQEETLHKMAIPTLEKVGERPTLIFTASVRHAHELAAVLNRYRANSAAAVDGGTPKEHRAQLVKDFQEGRLQFLANCAVLTEGFDAPSCAAIVMGRPTKSLSLYTQMLGRGLRPLPGIVDGIADATDRRLAILTSNKSNCLVLDFVGNSNHKLASSYDVLGGDYDTEARELAAQEARRQRKDVNEVMEQAAALLAIERQWKEREYIKAKNARYGSFNVNPFDENAPEIAGSDYTGPHRGTATDSQVRLLMNLGVAQKTAEGYSKKQAGAVIDSLAQTRCTIKQAQTLKKHGIDTEGVGMDRASRIIDAIASNGWKRPEVIPE